jgi:hypothetical protein
MRLRINKKGNLDIARKMIFWLVLSMMITGMTFVFIALLSMIESSSVLVPRELKGELISLRFANSPDCFAFQDKINGRIYPGIIDLEKFNSIQLNVNCYNLDEGTAAQQYNFQISLQNQGSSIETEMYAEGTDIFIIKKGVLIKERDIFSKDVLIIKGIEKIGKSNKVKQSEKIYDPNDDIGEAAWGGAAIK